MVLSIALRSTTYTYEARARDSSVRQGRKNCFTSVSQTSRLNDFGQLLHPRACSMRPSTLQCRLLHWASTFGALRLLNVFFTCKQRIMHHITLAFFLAFASLHINSTRMYWRLFLCFSTRSSLSVISSSANFYSCSSSQESFGVVIIRPWHLHPSEPS